MTRVITSGIFFLAKERPLATQDGNGPFTVSMLVFDRIAPLKVEPYRIFWIGAAACAWWAQNKHIEAGQPLQLQLSSMRSWHGQRRSATEIHAEVLACDLAPIHRTPAKPDQEARHACAQAA